MPSRLQIAKKDIADYFSDCNSKIFGIREIQGILREERGFWRLAQRTTAGEFLEYLCDRLDMTRIKLESENYNSIIRYAWGEPSPTEVALSIRKNAYMSHGSAVEYHQLTEQVPTTIYVNAEQTPKPPPSGKMTQAGINRAFANKQRRSNFVFTWKRWKIVVLSGKSTGKLGVIIDDQQDAAGFPVTGPERTLIDIAVRPEYGGGPQQVLIAYQRALELDLVSINRLLATLKKLDYRYPYHQAIGYYLSRTICPSHRLERLEKLGLEFDFFLAHGMKAKVFNDEWRLWLPQGL